MAGMSSPRTFSMSQDVIDTWAELSKDHNPLHVSDEYASTTKFGGTIAHGHYSLALIEDLLYAEHGAAWLRGGVLRELKFTAPVRPGRRYVIRLEPEPGGQRVEVLDAEDDTLAVRGFAALPD
jgi:acyl dehydratase